MLNGAVFIMWQGSDGAEWHLSRRAEVTSSQKFISIVRQPCRRIPFNKEDLGQWLYVPSFRTVCLFQDSLYDFKDYTISSRSLAILPLNITISAIKENSLVFFPYKI